MELNSNNIKTQKGSFNKKTFMKTLKEQKTGYLFILPQMLLFLIFMVYPVIEGVRLSFFKVGIRKNTFVGLDNYINIFSDENFVKSIKNTLIFVVFIVLLTIVFALFVAEAVYTKSTKFISFIRASYYVPSIVSMVVMSMVWSFLLNPTEGLVNHILSYYGHGTINFLGSEKWVMPVIILVTFLTNVGQAIVLYIAAIIGIPQDLTEAAEVDGANRWQRFKAIIWPLTKPTTLYILIMNTIAVMKIFVVIQLLTAGGPNYSSVTMMYYLYLKAFKFNNMGEASAIGTIMFILVIILSLIQFRLVNGKEKR